MPFYHYGSHINNLKEQYEDDENYESFDSDDYGQDSYDEER